LGAAEAGIASAGILAGIVAQLLRQHVGPLGALGASTAPWVSLGFLLVVTRRFNGGRFDRALNAAVLMATYLFGWLLSYHGLFAVRESVPLAAAWSQARPWVVAVAPASAVVGLLVAALCWTDWRADACLSAALAWSFPEVLRAYEHGWTYTLVVGVPTAVLGALPLAFAARRRRISINAIAIASVSLATVAYVLFPHLPAR
jgi:hypothetical protein